MKKETLYLQALREIVTCQKEIYIYQSQVIEINPRKHSWINSQPSLSLSERYKKSRWGRKECARVASSYNVARDWPKGKSVSVRRPRGKPREGKDRKGWPGLSPDKYLYGRATGSSLSSLGSGSLPRKYTADGTRCKLPYKKRIQAGAPQRRTESSNYED